MVSTSRLKILLPSLMIALAVMLGLGAWKGLSLQREERIFSLQARLGEQTSLLSADVRTQLEHLVQRLTLVSEERSGEHQLSVADMAIQSLAVWSRATPGETPHRQFYITQGYLPPAELLRLRSPAEDKTQERLVTRAFEGLSLIGMTSFFGGQNDVALMVVPLTGQLEIQGRITEVVSAHIQLSGLQRIFSVPLSSASFLLSSDGCILAHPDPGRVGKFERELSSLIFGGGSPGDKRVPGSVQFEGDLGDKGGRGWTTFHGSDGVRYAAHFQRIPVGNLAVVSTLPTEALGWNRKELVAACGLACLVLLLCGGFYYLLPVPTRASGRAQRPAAAPEQSSPVQKPASPESAGDESAASAGTRTDAELPQATDSTRFEEPSVTISREIRRDGLSAQPGSPPPPPEAPAAGEAPPRDPPPAPEAAEAAPTPAGFPDRKRVCSLHVGVWHYDGALSEMSAEEAVLALNDFHAIGQCLLSQMGGIYEKSSGLSFLGTWVTHGPEYGEVRRLLRCALALRAEFHRFNESRKIDGLPPLIFEMGADWGLALIAELGPEGRRASSVVGDLVSHARALSHLAVSVGTDLLVTQSLWTHAGGEFSGARALEASLTAVSGLITCYTVLGYRDREGKTVRIEWPELRKPLVSGGPASDGRPQIQELIQKEVRWLVNNGSSILGPLTPGEVAERLFAQDLDFDCECWAEGKGVRFPLSRSGIFGGSDEPDARFWVYDGGQMHGPMSEGFMKTALQHGAMSRNSYYCTVTTVNGWKPVTQLLKISAPRIPAPKSRESTLTEIPVEAAKALASPGPQPPAPENTISLLLQRDEPTSPAFELKPAPPIPVSMAISVTTNPMLVSPPPLPPAALPPTLPPPPPPPVAVGAPSEAPAEPVPPLPEAPPANPPSATARTAPLRKPKAAPPAMEEPPPEAATEPLAEAAASESDVSALASVMASIMASVVLEEKHPGGSDDPPKDPKAA